MMKLLFVFLKPFLKNPYVQWLEWAPSASTPLRDFKLIGIDYKHFR